MPVINFTSIPGVSSYATIQDEGVPLTQRDTINFVGAGVTATDSGGKTVVTIPGLTAASDQRIAYWSGGTLIGTDAGVYTDGDQVSIDKNLDAAAAVLMKSTLPSGSFSSPTWAANAILRWQLPNSHTGSLAWQVTKSNGVAADILSYGSAGADAIVFGVPDTGTIQFRGVVNAATWKWTTGNGDSFTFSTTGTTGLLFGNATAMPNPFITQVSQSIVGTAETLTLKAQSNTSTISASKGGALNCSAGDETGAAGGVTENGGDTDIKAGDATGSNGTATFNGGTCTVRGGDATGSTGTRNGGNMVVRPGTGNTAQGKLRLQAGDGSNALSVFKGGGINNIFLFNDGTANAQAMDGGVFEPNAPTAPTGNPTNAIFRYTAAGAGVARGSGGTITTYAPA
jgi:hypothetical protein